MHAGRIEQIGTPSEVYDNPATVFVADFLGVSNLMDADAVAWARQECTVRVGDFRLRAACGETTARGAVKVVARPERVRLLAHGSSEENSLPGMVERTVYVGSSLQVIVRLATGASMQVSVANTGGGVEAYQQGTPVAVQVPADALRVLAPAVGAPAVEGEPAAEPVSA
jgi:ABC-type Fe3+/spermidine/putrescine transport system ATPase subunit